jgi:hypothetical protein
MFALIEQNILEIYMFHLIFALIKIILAIYDIIPNITKYFNNEVGVRVDIIRFAELELGFTSLLDFYSNL